MNSMMMRPAARLLALAALSAAAACAHAQGQASPPMLGGVWQVQSYIPAITTVDGRAPPMKPEAKALLDKRIADRQAGKTDDPVEVCLRPGTPRVMFQDRPVMILQTPRKVTFVHEYQHILRHIHMDEPLPPAEELDPAFGGHSVGRWEGDTLVIDTHGFNDQTRLDEAGLPHSPDMKVTERVRLVAPNTLEAVITIDDPANYTAPWNTRVVFNRAPPGTTIQEDICAEKLLVAPLPNHGPD